MTNALRRRGEVMYNLPLVLVSGASLAIVGSPTFTSRREFMMIRSLIHVTSAMLASTVLALSLAAAPARAAVITINGSNCTWDSTSQALTCSSNTGGGSAPSGCTLTANGTNPATLPASGTVLLNASCGGGGAPTSYAWSGPGLGSSTANSSQSINITQTSSFSVTPSNATGSGNAASVTVTLGGPPPPPPPGSLANCTNQGLSVLGSVNPITWGQSASWLSQSNGAFGNNTVWLFQLDVPSTASPSTTYGSFTVTEAQGNNTTTRQMTVSSTPCDFRPMDVTGATGPQTMSIGSTARVLYGVGTPSFYDLLIGNAPLTAGQRYYISVRNYSGGNTCSSNNCPVIGTDQTAAP